jgi:hypothetical protein
VSWESGSAPRPPCFVSLASLYSCTYKYCIAFFGWICICHLLLICQFMGIWGFTHFRLLWIMLRNIGAQIFLWSYIFKYCTYLTTTRTALL